MNRAFRVGGSWYFLLALLLLLLLLLLSQVVLGAVVSRRVGVSCGRIAAAIAGGQSFDCACNGMVLVRKGCMGDGWNMYQSYHGQDLLVEYRDYPAWKAVLQRHKVAASSCSKKSSPSSFRVCLSAFYLVGLFSGFV